MEDCAPPYVSLGGSKIRELMVKGVCDINSNPNSYGSEVNNGLDDIFTIYTHLYILRLPVSKCLNAGKPEISHTSPEI